MPRPRYDRRCDADGDGVLTAEELKAAQALQRQSTMRARSQKTPRQMGFNFAEADADGGGVVTAEEMQAMQAARQLAAQPKRTPRQSRTPR